MFTKVDSSQGLPHTKIIILCHVLLGVCLSLLQPKTTHTHGGWGWGVRGVNKPSASLRQPTRGGCKAGRATSHPDTNESVGGSPGSGGRDSQQTGTSHTRSLTPAQGQRVQPWIGPDCARLLCSSTMGVRDLLMPSLLLEVTLVSASCPFTPQPGHTLLW